MKNNQRGKMNPKTTQNLTLNQTPQASSSDTLEQSLQSHHDWVRHSEEPLLWSDLSFTHRLFQLRNDHQLQCLRLPQSLQPLNIYRSQCKLPPAPQLLAPPTLQQNQGQMIHRKSSISSTLPSDIKPTIEVVGEVEVEVEEAVEAVEAVVEVMQDLLHNLSQQARAKLLSQLQWTLEPWARNQQSLQAIAPKQMTSLKKLRHISTSAKTLLGLILQSRKSPLFYFFWKRFITGELSTCS